MKKIIYILIIAIFFLFSCIKENTQIKNNWLNYCIKNKVDTSVFKKDTVFILKKDTFNY